MVLFRVCCFRRDIVIIKDYCDAAKSIDPETYFIIEHLGEYSEEKVYAEYQENINLATVAYGGLEQATEDLYPFVEKIDIR